MRLFIAIEIDPAARGVLNAAQRTMQLRCEGVRWVPSEQLHLTVKFLGETADDVVGMLAPSLAQAVLDVKPFDLTLCGAGCFPEGGPVRIVWAGAEEPSGALARCVERVERETRALGFPPENRAYSPHITLGRVRDDRSYGLIRRVVDAVNIGPVRCNVSLLSLMASELSPGGSVYRRVAAVPLRI